MAEFVVSDIHGQLPALIDVLKKAKFNANRDTLYVLGDMIDWGEDPIGVINYIRNIPNKVVLLGNHELLCVSAMLHNNSFAMDCWQSNRGYSTYCQLMNLSVEQRKEILNWLASLPAKHETSKFYLTHSAVIQPQEADNWGMNYHILELMHKGIFADEIYQSIWKRVIPAEVPQSTRKILVSGHTCTKKYHGEYSIFFDLDNRYINIDCGAKGVGIPDKPYKLALMQLNYNKNTYRVWYSDRRS